MPVGPPARQPQAVPANPELPVQEPVPAPGGRSRRSGRGPCRPAPREGLRCTESWDRDPDKLRNGPSLPRQGPQHTASARGGPGAGLKRLPGSRRSRNRGQGGRQVPRPHQAEPNPHQPPQGRLPQGEAAARLPPGAHTYAARHHAAAAAAAEGRSARDPGGVGRRTGGAGCRPRERRARGGRRQGERPVTDAEDRPGRTRQGERARARARHQSQRQRGRTGTRGRPELEQRTAGRRA